MSDIMDGIDDMDVVDNAREGDPEDLTHFTSEFGFSKEDLDLELLKNLDSLDQLIPFDENAFEIQNPLSYDKDVQQNGQHLNQRSVDPIAEAMTSADITVSHSEVTTNGVLNLPSLEVIENMTISSGLDIKGDLREEVMAMSSEPIRKRGRRSLEEQGFSSQMIDERKKRQNRESQQRKRDRLRAKKGVSKDNYKAVAKKTTLIALIECLRDGQYVGSMSAHCDYMIVLVNSFDK